MGIKLEILKGIAGFGTAVGAGVIVANVTKYTTPAGANKIVRTLIHMGEFGIAGFVGEKAAEYTVETIDQVATVFTAGKALKDGIKEGIRKDAETSAGVDFLFQDEKPKDDTEPTETK